MTRSGPPGSELEIVEDDHEETVPPEAEGLASTIFLIVAIALLLLAPMATQSQPEGRGWYLAPVAWPLVSLGMAAIAGLVLAWGFLRDLGRSQDRTAFLSQAGWAFGGSAQAIEYALYFCVYLAAVSWLGFGIATLIFLVFVTWRAGLRGRKWVLTACCVTAGIVLVFRVGIGLWFPLAPVFELLPDWLGNTLGTFL
ncbi:tripartite tricarboxylate transporter TctB family protein [Frigidibacter oleivorans]|uniref:tripartite tricarboxylate transporter TctB family protein n=1 Tax=Frigidibacter oleivorans TaxID=2487129 RepID=UPI000F8D9D4B|nr:tripartite tricarboxylate transporter TctB family protein [Frigidibacter oleivorans]